MSSKVVKNYQVILEDKSFCLAPDVIPKDEVDYDEIDKTDSDEDRKKQIQIDIQKMLEEAARESKIIEDKAQAEATQVIEEAYETSKGIYEKSKNDGYSQGYEEGLQIGRNKSEEYIQQALDIKNRTEEIYAKMLENSESEMIQLVLDTLKLILDERIEEDISIIETSIKKGIERCTSKENLVLRVSPYDYGYAISIRNRILALSEHVDELEIKEDRAFEKGSCVVESASGSVDSGIYTQYQKVESVFLELLNEV